MIVRRNIRIFLILFDESSHSTFYMPHEKYKVKGIEMNEPDFDWLHSPVEVRALYHCNCRLKHDNCRRNTAHDNVSLMNLYLEYFNARYKLD